MRGLLFFALILLSQVVFGQEKKIRKAFKFLKTDNYKEAAILLNEFNSDNQNSPLGAYLAFKIYSKPGSPVYNIQEAFKSIQNANKWMNSNSYDKSWCKSFGLCHETLPFQIDSIAMIELVKIEENKSDNAYQNFLNNFKDTPANQKGLESFHSWKYQLALEKKTTKAIELFIEQYPNSNLVSTAKQKIEEIDYNKCIENNDVAIMENFIKKYPNSLKSNELKPKIIEIEYKKCESKNDTQCFENFLKKYPNSSYSEKLHKIIEDLEFTNATKQGNKEPYEAFMKKYPYSIYTSEIKNKIEEIDFTNAEKSSSKESLESFIRNYPNSKYLEEAKKKLRNLNVESIIIAGSGSSRELAIKSCISKAIGLLTEMYIKTESIVENELLINEIIKQISSGEILDYEVIQESIHDEINWEITLKLTVRVDTFSGFFASKGMNLNFDKNSFSYKIKNQKVKESQELSIIYDVIGALNEGLQTSFDYKLQAFTPIKSKLTTLDWKIPLQVVVMTNDNFRNNYKSLLTTIKFLALSEKEIEEYKKYNKKIYPIVLKSAKSNKRSAEVDSDVEIDTDETNAINNVETTYYLRNRNSLKAINLLLNNYFNFLTSFNIKCEIDSLNGHNIELVGENWGKKRFFYLSDPTLNEGNLERERETIYDASVSHNNLEEFIVDIDWINPLSAFFENNNSTVDNSSYKIELKNLIEEDTLAVIRMNHFVKLNDLKKIANYSINSNGLRFQYRKKGMVISNINAINKRILLLNYFDKVPFSMIDTTFQQIPFNKLSNIRIPNLVEFNQIYSLPFSKLLILPNFAWCNYDKICYQGDHAKYYTYTSEWSSGYKRIHTNGCQEKARATNVILIYDL